MSDSVVYRQDGRSIASRWSILLGVLSPLLFQACPEQVSMSDAIAAALDGCFEHPAGHDRGWVEIMRGEQNLFTCHGAGIGELGMALEDEWGCVGEVTDAVRRDDGGMEASAWLRISVSTDGRDVFMVDAAYGATASGEETLVLQRGERPDVELVRCP